MSVRQLFLNHVINGTSTWGQISLALAAIVVVRTTMELMLESHHSVLYHGGAYADLVIYAHIFIAWCCTFLLLGIFARMLLPIDSLQAGRIVCVFSPIIWIVPFVDAILTGGKGSDISYGTNWNDFIYNFVNLFNPMADIVMVSPGVRIEIFLVCLVTLSLANPVFKCGKLNAVLLSIAIYSSIFFLGYLPAVYYTLHSLVFTNPDVVAMTTPEEYFYMYVPLLLLLVAVAYRLGRIDGYLRTPMLRWLLFPSRLLSYMLLLVFGCVLATVDSGTIGPLFSPVNVSRLVCACLSIALLFSAARILNDIHDRPIDARTNVTRPLVTGAISAQAAKRLGQFCFAGSFLFAVPTDSEFLPFWLTIASLAYLYSAPPLRFRRFYPIGHIVLAAIGGLVFVAGASLADPTDLYQVLVRQEIIGPVVLAFFLLAHLKDLKDIEGDRFGSAQNIFVWLKWRKTASTLLLGGFYGAMALISYRLGLAGISTTMIIAAFLVLSVVYIYVEKDLRKLDRIIPISLAAVASIAAIWLYGLLANLNP